MFQTKKTVQFMFRSATDAEFERAFRANDLSLWINC